MNIQDECIKIHSKYGMSEMANYKIQLLFDSEIEKVKKEYEDKLRWIPIEEKLPAIKQPILLKINDDSEYICVGFMRKEYQFVQDIEFTDKDIVTHWRWLSFL